MWGNLRRDFGEFVSTVAADATDTLESIDQTLDEPLVLGGRRRHRTDDDDDDDDDGKDVVVSSEALIDPDTGIVLSSVVADDDHRKPDPAAWKAPAEASPEEMKERLISREDVFADPLVSGEAGGCEAGKEPGAETSETEPEAPNKEEEEEPSNEKSEENEADANEKSEAKEKSEANEADAKEMSEAKEKSEANDADAIEKKSEADAIAAFLEEFDVASKTEEISELLKADVALQTTFSILSDSVTYKDFWTRYYYRIADEDRLPETYSFYYRRHAEELEAAEAADAGETPRMGGLSSFFGGVVNRLTDEGAETGTDIDTSGMAEESFESEDGAVAAARSALGFLSTVAGGGGRPPFVMNTAVSDDDYDDDELNETVEDEESEESEVELGWDDDDDDDDDDLDDDGIAFKDGDDRSETVDFKDAEKEGLLEQLDQARAERDALQKTVQMQAEELKKAAAGTGSVTASSPDDAGNDGDAASESLKLQLFEKDAELAALRSKLNDRHVDDDDDDGPEAASATEEVRRLNDLLADRDRELAALKSKAEVETQAQESELVKVRAEAKSAGEKAAALATSLQTQLAASRAEPRDSEASARQELERLRAEGTANREESSALREELRTLRAELETSRTATDAARAEADTLRAKLEKNARLPPSPSSSSTGVRVEAPEKTPAIPDKPVVNAAATAALGLEPSANDDDDDGGGDDDGWGDDW